MIYRITVQTACKRRETKNEGGKSFCKKNTNMLHQLELYWTKMAGIFINVIICSSSLERQNVVISKKKEEAYRTAILVLLSRSADRCFIPVSCIDLHKKIQIQSEIKHMTHFNIINPV